MKVVQMRPCDSGLSPPVLSACSALQAPVAGLRQNKLFYASPTGGSCVAAGIRGDGIRDVARDTINAKPVQH
jgi:hypothetical protein